MLQRRTHCSRHASSWACKLCCLITVGTNLLLGLMQPGMSPYCSSHAGSACELCRFHVYQLEAQVVTRHLRCLLAWMAAVAFLVVCMYVWLCVCSVCMPVPHMVVECSCIGLQVSVAHVRWHFRCQGMLQGTECLETFMADTFFSVPRQTFCELRL